MAAAAARADLFHQQPATASMLGRMC
jgi:hypothetical protein